MPRIAIATICKDESAFLERWKDSAADADLLVLGDTGSTDDSVAIARKLGITVHEICITPWRFDDARNTVMSLLPEDLDLVITLDCDEVIRPGWREALEQAWEANPDSRRFSYLYTWSWQPGQRGIAPDVQFLGERCHSRSGWRWQGPVHEVLVPSGMETGAWVAGTQTPSGGFALEHYADDDKPRTSYLGLLELAVAEEPDNPRQAYYLGRELYFVQDWNRARVQLMAYLNMPAANWPPERASAWRMIAAMDTYPERWLLRAVAEDPGRREAWVDLMRYYQGRGEVDEAVGCARRALEITGRSYDFLTEAAAWDDEMLQKVAAREVFD